MRAKAIAIALFLTAGAYGDVITLKSGRVINGTFLGGTARQVEVQEGDQIETLEVSDIVRIDFGNAPVAARPSDNRPVLRRASPPPASSSPDDRPTLMRGDNAATPAPADPDGPPTLRRQAAILRPDAEPSVSAAPAAAPPEPVQLSAGTNLVVRMIDGVDSERNTVGQTFAASLDEPLLIDGEPVIPRGADVIVKLVDDKESGKLTGRTSLTMDLVSVKVNGRMVDINTQTVTEESSSRGARTAKTAGGGAALGALIGAVAGHGKGAAFGAGAGAAAGAGAEILTKGQRVRIPSETRLTFVVENPVRIR